MASIVSLHPAPCQFENEPAWIRVELSTAAESLFERIKALYDVQAGVKIDDEMLRANIHGALIGACRIKPNRPAA